MTSSWSISVARRPMSTARLSRPTQRRGFGVHCSRCCPSFDQCKATWDCAPMLPRSSGLTVSGSRVLFRSTNPRWWRPQLGARPSQTSFRPRPEDWAIDQALASSCVFHAVRRHCGRLIIASRPNQPVRISTDGPDLRQAPLVIGTGGILVRSPSGEAILRDGLDRCDDRCLTPRAPQFAIDSSYVLAAAGLLGDIDSGAALRLMRDTLSLDVAPVSTGAAR